MTRVRLATVWLDGCSGCHMSLLDTDERLLELVAKADIVYSPIVDAKEFPHDVDVTLVEGSVSSDDDLEKIRHVRQHTRILIAFGDCGVNGNVPAMRNQHGPETVIERVYFENADVQQQRPGPAVPALLERVRPLHEVVHVDLHLPGCPPSADLIFYVLNELCEGRTPDLTARFRFG
jgi:NAD-reducing hydrogenase small subunit